MSTKPYIDRLRQTLANIQRELDELVDFGRVARAIEPLSELPDHPEIIDEPKIVDELVRHIIDYAYGSGSGSDKILDAFSVFCKDDAARAKLLPRIIKSLGDQPFKERIWEKRTEALSVLEFVAMNDSSLITSEIAARLRTNITDMANPDYKGLFTEAVQLKTQNLLEDLEDDMPVSADAFESMLQEDEPQNRRRITGLSAHILGLAPGNAPGPETPEP